jgi:nucleoside-diphosphate-sugar epimerase
MSLRILLTGANGFVGRQVLRYLLADGHSVSIVARSHDSLNSHHLNDLNAIFETQSLFTASDDWMQHICRRIDLVIHCAWYAEPGKYLQSAQNLDCAAGTLRLAKAASQSGVRRFVGVGTCFEYDLRKRFLTVDTPLLPSSPYAASKASTFLVLSHCLNQLGLDFAWTRLFYLYGEGEDSRRLVAYLHKCMKLGIPAELSTGNQIRDFLDIKDASRLLASFATSTHRGAVNICSGKGISIRQLAETIAASYGRQDLLRFGARQDNLTDPPFVVGVPTIL